MKPDKKDKKNKNDNDNANNVISKENNEEELFEGRKKFTKANKNDHELQKFEKNNVALTATKVLKKYQDENQDKVIFF